MLAPLPAASQPALLLGVLNIALALAASFGAIMHKRDHRAAVGWLGLIWLVPFLGALLYFLFGINRIRRRARQLGRETVTSETDPEEVAELPMDPLLRCTQSIAGFTATRHNHLALFHSGDECYQAMCEAINQAKQRVVLSSYIFQNDAVGRRLLDHLQAAQQRGVEVRVLIDGAGLYYSLPTIWGELKRRHIPSARFLHSLLPWRMPFINLRNHRKLLIIDEVVGFTGGMNIAMRHTGQPPAQQDTHFRLDGPVVAQMAQIFAEDWAFTSGEQLAPLPHAHTTDSSRDLIARGLADGPDADFDRLRWTLLAAVREARHEIVIITPYFLPDPTLLTALNTAALAGVNIQIVVPERTNFRVVDWAMRPHLEAVLRFGCEVWLSKPPFDHSKLMIIDQRWAMIGSSNWDARSLRLNFEFNLEIIGATALYSLHAAAEKKLSNSRQLTIEELRNRALALRLRDAACRLLTPYL